MAKILGKFGLWLYRRYAPDAERMGRFFTVCGLLYAEGRDESELFQLNTRGYDDPACWIWNLMPPGITEQLQQIRKQYGNA